MKMDEKTMLLYAIGAYVAYKFVWPKIAGADPLPVLPPGPDGKPAPGYGDGGTPTIWPTPAP